MKRHQIYVTQTGENPAFGLTFYRNLRNPALLYVKSSQQCWHGMDADGHINGPLKSGMAIHIFNASGQKQSQEITQEWEG